MKTKIYEDMRDIGHMEPIVASQTSSLWDEESISLQHKTT